MGWPQYTYLALIFVGFGMHVAKHGEPRQDKYNFVSHGIAAAIILWILSSGGFFG